MELEEESYGPPRGLLLSLGVIGLVLGGVIAGEFVFKLQPGLAVTGCGQPGTVCMPAGVGSNTALSYSPSTVTVVIGDNNTLTFLNRDTAVHTVTALDKSFNSGDIKAGQSWTYTFSTPGNYSYYCIYHTWMKGTIRVVSA